MPYADKIQCCLLLMMKAVSSYPRMLDRLLTTKKLILEIRTKRSGSFATRTCILEYIADIIHSMLIGWDPRKDPFGHLLIDAPKFLVGIIFAISIGKLVGSVINDSKRVEDDNKESNCLMD